MSLYYNYFAQRMTKIKKYAAGFAALAIVVAS
jgi:hypothetical protein